MASSPTPPPEDDDAALAWLESRRGAEQVDAIDAILLEGRRGERLLVRALEQRALDPKLPLRYGTSLIHKAAAFGAVELLRILIRWRGVDVDEEDERGWAPIHWAMRCNSLALDGTERIEAAALFLFGASCDVSKSDGYGVTPLMLACWRGWRKMVDALVVAGADVHARDAKGRPVLWYAATVGHEDLALHLLETHGAPWDGGGAEETALMVAVKTRQVRLLKAILLRMRTSGMGAAAQKAELEQAADRLFESQGSLECLKILVEVGGLDMQACTIIPWHERPTSLLHEACRMGDQEVLEYLIEQGCDPYERTAEGKLPHWLVPQSSFNLQHCLISRFAVMSAPPAVDVHRAVEAQLARPAMVMRRLLVPETDVDALAWLRSLAGRDQGRLVSFVLQDHPRGDHLLAWAVARGLVDPRGASLIHDAAFYGAVELLRCLVLQCAVDVNKEDETGKQPIHIVLSDEMDHDEECMEAAALFLIGAGCNVNVPLPSGHFLGGMTPLMLTGWRSWRGATEALLVRGADVGARDGKGRPVLWHAAEGPDEGIPLLLLETYAAPWEGPLENSVLSMATEMGKVRLVKAILQRMRTSGMHAGAYEEELRHAADHLFKDQDNSLECLKALVEAGLSVRVRVAESNALQPGYGSTFPLLHMACRAGDRAMVEYLIEQGCDPYQHDARRNLAHEVAAQQGNIDLQQWLLARFPVATASPAAAAAAAAAAEARPDTTSEPSLPEGAAAAISAEQEPSPLQEYLEAHAPASLKCPITLHLFVDPVVLVGDGFTYSRAAIVQHLVLRHTRGLALTSPTTNIELEAAHATLIHNYTLRSVVEEYKENKTREWEAAEQRWREQQAGDGEEKAGV